MANPHQQQNIPPPPLYSAAQDFNAPVASGMRSQQQPQMSPTTSIFPDLHMVQQRFAVAAQSPFHAPPLAQAGAMVRQLQSPPQQSSIRMPNLVPAPNYSQQQPPSSCRQENSQQKVALFGVQSPAGSNYLVAVKPSATASETARNRAISGDVVAATNGPPDANSIPPISPVVTCVSAPPVASAENDEKSSVELVPISPSEINW